MLTTFYAAAVIAIVATALALSRMNVVHGLLYLIVSLLAVALMFLALGAPFVAALEVIIYAGAIIVLFVFAMMLLNLGLETVEQERRWLPLRACIGPLVLTLLLLADLIFALSVRYPTAAGPPPEVYVSADTTHAIEPRQVGIVLFDRYALGVELASMLLLASLIGAFHLGRRDPGRK